MTAPCDKTSLLPYVGHAVLSNRDCISPSLAKYFQARNKYSEWMRWTFSMSTWEETPQRSLP